MMCVNMDDIALKEITSILMSINGVETVGLASSTNTVYAYVKNKTAQKKVPAQINGVTIISRVVGKIKPA